MPALQSQVREGDEPVQGELHFPPVTRDHILHCSYDYWFPKYRTSCIRSRIIKLSPEFVSYLGEDSIILADDEEDGTALDDAGWAQDGDDDEDDEDEEDDDDDANPNPPPRLPPNERFPELHQAIRDAIRALGGAAAPKLNWSSPKDATWISRHANTVKCTTPNDVYLLLKSSSFITHDLEHAFDDTVPVLPPPPSSSSSSSNPVVSTSSNPSFTPVLVLRAFFSPLPSLEFRCFVKDRTLVAISSRDLNYYAFLASLRPAIAARARELFFSRLRLTFPEACFVFDVYIPEAEYSDSDDDSDSDEEREERDPARRLGRARLIDINPWAPCTDPLLFDWRELLGVRVPRPVLGAAGDGEGDGPSAGETETETETETEEEEEDEEEEYKPEIRLIERDDPAAYNFSSTQYSAHKLPRDVVDASLAGEGGMREFARRWRRVTEGGDWEESDEDDV